MTHYIVILNWATDDEEGIDIIGVAHTIEEAKEIFDVQYKLEQEYVMNHDYTVFENIEGTLFDAGEEGYWSAEHTKLYIQEVIQ